VGYSRFFFVTIYADCVFANVNKTVKDELTTTISSGDKLSIAVAYAMRRAITPFPSFAQYRCREESVSCYNAVLMLVARTR